MKLRVRAFLVRHGHLRATPLCIHQIHGDYVMIHHRCHHCSNSSIRSWAPCSHRPGVVTNGQAHVSLPWLSFLAGFSHNFSGYYRCLAYCQNCQIISNYAKLTLFHHEFRPGMIAPPPWLLGIGAGHLKAWTDLPC